MLVVVSGLEVKVCLPVSRSLNWTFEKPASVQVVGKEFNCFLWLRQDSVVIMLLI